MNEDPTQGERQRQQAKAIVIGAVRATGAVLLLAGTAIFFDTGGIAGAIGVGDGIVNKILGGGLLAAGIADYLIVPKLLDKKMR